MTRIALARRIIRAQRRVETLLWLGIYMGSVYVSALLLINPPQWGN